MHPKPVLLLCIAAIAAMFAAFASSDSAGATSGAASFTYNGTGSQVNTVFDQGLIVGEADPFFEEFLVRAKLEITTKATVAAPSDFSLNAPDGNIRQDSNLPVTTQNVAKDGSGKEFKLALTATLTVHIDYDNNDDQILTCQGYGEDDGGGGDSCSDFPFDVSKTLLDKDMTAPYAGSDQPFSDNVNLFSIPVCQLIIGLDICSVKLDLNTNATLSATAGGSVTDPGFHADRQFTSNGGNLGSPFLLNWPSPGPVVDSFHIPCSATAGTDLTYALTDNSYDARVTSATTTGNLILDLIDPIPDITILSLTANLIPGGPIDVQSGAVDYTQALGTIQAENQPPVIATAGGPYSGNEGSPITFTASATDNCDSSLEYEWSFSDGSTVFGNGASHVFADNGSYSGHLTVRDDAGNTAGMDFGPIVVGNVAPTVDLGPDKQSDWGIPVALHANGTDVGSVDNSSLNYTWDFNDPNDPVGAAGQDVSHVFSQPGTYNVQVTVKDKDGDSNTDTQVVTVTKRDTIIGYTGALTGKPNQVVTLSAQVTDEYGQGVPGVTVTFVLGTGASAQTVTGVTNGSGVATAALTVKQKPPGNVFPLSVSAAANGRYNVPGNSALGVGFKVGNK